MVMNSVQYYKNWVYIVGALELNPTPTGEHDAILWTIQRLDINPITKQLSNPVIVKQGTDIHQYLFGMGGFSGSFLYDDKLLVIPYYAYPDGFNLDYKDDITIFEMDIMNNGTLSGSSVLQQFEETEELSYQLSDSNNHIIVRILDKLYLPMHVLTDDDDSQSLDYVLYSLDLNEPGAIFEPEFTLDLSIYLDDPQGYLYSDIPYVGGLVLTDESLIVSFIDMEEIITQGDGSIEYNYINREFFGTFTFDAPEPELEEPEGSDFIINPRSKVSSNSKVDLYGYTNGGGASVDTGGVVWDPNNPPKVIGGPITTHGVTSTSKVTITGHRYNLPYTPPEEES